MCSFMLELDLLKEYTGSIKLIKSEIRREGTNERRKNGRKEVWFK